MLSHAWPFLLVFVLVFGGGIARTISKALGRSIAGAAIQAVQNAPTPRVQVAFSDDDTARGTQLVRALEASVAVAMAERRSQIPIAEARVEVQKTAKTPRNKSAKAVVPGVRQTRLGDILTPLPIMKPHRPLAIARPIEPLAARAPFAPLSAARH